MKGLIELFLSFICRLVSFAVEDRIERILTAYNESPVIFRMEERASKLRHSLAAVWAARHSDAPTSEAQSAYDESWALLEEFWGLASGRTEGPASRQERPTAPKQRAFSAEV